MHKTIPSRCFAYVMLTCGPGALKLYIWASVVRETIKTSFEGLIRVKYLDDQLFACYTVLEFKSSAWEDVLVVKETIKETS